MALYGSLLMGFSLSDCGYGFFGRSESLTLTRLALQCSIDAERFVEDAVPTEFSALCFHTAGQAFASRRFALSMPPSSGLFVWRTDHDPPRDASLPA